jgi:hypothetical protein
VTRRHSQIRDIAPRAVCEFVPSSPSRHFESALPLPSIQQPYSEFIERCGTIGQPQARTAQRSIRFAPLKISYEICLDRYFLEL